MGENAIQIKFHAILPFSVSFIQPVNILIRNDEFLVVSNYGKQSQISLLSTFRVIGKVGLLSLFFMSHFL